MFPSKIPGCHEIKVVLLEGKGSVLLALEGACRKRSVQMESLRSGEVALLAANCWHRHVFWWKLLNVNSVWLLELAL